MIADASRRSRIGARGTTTAEFALIGSLLISLLFGVIEIGRYLYTIQSVRMATSDAVRLVTVRGSQNKNAGIADCSGMSGSLSGAAAGRPTWTIRN